MNNAYEDIRIPYFYRRNAFQLTMHGFFTCYKKLYPSVTLKEVAGAFLKEYNIFEDEYSPDSVVLAFYKINKDLIDAERFQNKQGQKNSKG